MKQFIKVCESSYGRTTGIYRYININHITSLRIEVTDYEVNVVVDTIQNKDYIILRSTDLQKLVGEETFKELTDLMLDYADGMNKRGIYESSCMCNGKK